MAEFIRTAHSCQMHPFAAESLAQQRWDELVSVARASKRRTRRPRRFPLLARLRELDAGRPFRHPANVDKTPEFLVAGDGCE